MDPEINNSIGFVLAIEKIQKEVKMTVTGKYVKDSEHIFVFTEDTIYTIALFYGTPIGWRSTKVGDVISKRGMILTKEQFEIWKSYCCKIGTFELPG